MTPVMYRSWKCGICSKVLAFILPGGILQIKYKDLYLKVAGTCEYTCRGCGTRNVFDQSKAEVLDGQA